MRSAARPAEPGNDDDPFAFVQRTRRRFVQYLARAVAEADDDLMAGRHGESFRTALADGGSGHDIRERLHAAAATCVQAVAAAEETGAFARDGTPSMISTYVSMCRTDSTTPHPLQSPPARALPVAAGAFVGHDGRVPIRYDRLRRRPGTLCRGRALAQRPADDHADADEVENRERNAYRFRSRPRRRGSRACPPGYTFPIRTRTRTTSRTTPTAPLGP